MNEKKELYILWASDNPLTAHHMVFMYAINSMGGWWDEVTVIIWGASAKLAAEDESIRLKMQMAQAQGVKLTACVACARQFDAVEKLESLGVEVVGWGARLTELMQSGAHILTV